MRPITLHILTHNNRGLLEQTLQSALSLNGRIVVIDTGSADGTQDLARSRGAFVESVKIPEDYSKLRNDIVSRTKTDWQMYLEPGEQIISGDISLDGKAWHVSVLQGDMLTKEIRLWRKEHIKFENPVYECLTDDNAGVLDLTIYRQTPSLQSEEKIKKWKSRAPMSSEPIYYEALAALNHMRWDDFLATAEKYFFQASGKTMGAIMLRYYLGMVQAYYKSDSQAATKNTLMCLAEKPLMAEFWCLLGDIYYKAAQYKKALAFYENGILLGSRRLQNDLWPLHISKYHEYPNKMIASCKKLIQETAVYIT